MGKIDDLKELALLREKGLLTEEEFQKEKEKVLNKNINNKLPNNISEMNKSTEILGYITILIPIFFGITILFMNVITFMRYYQLIVIFVVILTSILIALEAFVIGFGKNKGENNPIIIFFAILLLWFIAYPYYFHLRRKRGLKISPVSAIISVIFFIVSLILSFDIISTLNNTNNDLVRLKELAVMNQEINEKIEIQRRELGNNLLMEFSKKSEENIDIKLKKAVEHIIKLTTNYNYISAEKKEEVINALYPEMKKSFDNGELTENNIDCILKQNNIKDIDICEPDKKIQKTTDTQKNTKVVINEQNESISNLVISETEITVNQFEFCIKNNCCSRNNFKTNKMDKNCNYGNVAKINHPMNCINLAGAKEFCNCSNNRLPTEKEWLYFAKANQNFIYSGSNNVDYVAWYNANSNETTHEVQKKKPNNFGIYDMSGNVWEWIDDSSGVVLGGGFRRDKEGVSINSKYFLNINSMLDGIGFRCINLNDLGPD